MTQWKGYDSTNRVHLDRMTVPELYSLAWEVAERLVELEMERLWRSSEPAVALAGVQTTTHGGYVFNSADDNYGCF